MWSEEVFEETTWSKEVLKGMWAEGGLKTMWVT